MTDDTNKIPEWMHAWQNSKENPWLFATGVLQILPYGVDNPENVPQLEKWQDEFLRSFYQDSKDSFTDNPRHSIRAGHGVGKGFCLAILAVWFPLTHFDSKTVVTANSQDQLRDNNWPEIKKVANFLPPLLRDQIDIQEERILVKAEPEMGFVVRRTASKSNPEALQGIHANHVLYLIDEACFDDETEILTDQGWKFFCDLTGEEMVLTKPQTGGAAYFEWPSRYFKHAYEGDLVTYDSRALSFAVTPNHKLWRGIRNPVSHDVTWGFQEAGDKLNQRIVFDRTFEWEGDEPLTIEIPMFKGRTTHPRRVVSMWDWMEFLGWFLSEGSIGKQSGRPYSVVITQRSEDARRRIADCCKRMGFNPKDYPNGASYVGIHSVQLATFLHDGKRAPQKRIPRYVMGLSPRLIRIFLDAYLEGDGYMKGNREIYYTSSRGMADDLQELLLRTGVYASICERNLPESDFGTHIAHPGGPGYVVGSFVTEHAAVRTLNMSKRPYSGFVYCLEVPETHLVYVRRNGACHWSGNSGIDDIVFEVAQGSLSTQGACAVMFSNPTRPDGFFFDTHHRLRDRWRCWHISSRTVPRAQGHIEDCVLAYGEGSNKVRIRVDGEFPVAADDVVIPLQWVLDAVDREVVPLDYIPVWGVDVARFGDDSSALAKRQANRLLEPVKEYKGKDLMQLVGILHDEYINTHEDMLPKEILIDVIGIGAGVVDRMRELGLPARGVNVGEGAASVEKCMRLRDELWWRAREWFQSKDCSIPHDEKLIAQLTGPTYDFHSNGKIVVESKKDMKERSMRSPDLADALCLTFHGFSKRKIPMRRSRTPAYRNPWAA